MYVRKINSLISLESMIKLKWLVLKVSKSQLVMVMACLCTLFQFGITVYIDSNKLYGLKNDKDPVFICECNYNGVYDDFICMY
jgi:hypothetical protein